MENVPTELTSYREDGLDLPVLVWRLAGPELTISSGALGGGIGARCWVVNATVPMSYHPTDVPAHLGELAAGLGLAGPGTALVTGVDVARFVTATDTGVTAAATVGLGDPVWAAAPAPAPAPRVGTINLVVRVPARLSEAALVNAVATAAEAKAQALGELGISGTGTCTDATVIHCPLSGSPERYGGPRSTWGAPLARAVHAAVLRGGRDWLADPRPGIVRADRPLAPPPIGARTDPT
jgi:adenosylcobinamide amidohydrolase